MKSKFNGGLLGLIGMNILCTALVSFTFGLGAPWALCLYISWFFKHTTIDGQQLTFDGTGGQLFGSYIKWFLLCIVTFGIYLFWLPFKMINWVVSHVHTIPAKPEE